LVQELLYARNRLCVKARQRPVLVVNLYTLITVSIKSKSRLEGVYWQDFMGCGHKQNLSERDRLFVSNEVKELKVELKKPPVNHIGGFFARVPKSSFSF